MATGNLTIQANVAGGPSGSRTFGPLTVTAPSAVDETLPVVLAPGANTVAVPAGTTSMLISGPNATVPTPNPPYAGTLTLKGIAGDTGIAISAKWPTLLEWDTVTGPPASIVLSATVACTVVCWFQ